MKKMYLSEFGISEENLLSGNNLPFISKDAVKNGLVREMYLLANKYFTAPAEKVACFLSSLLKLELSSIAIPALNTKINRLINEYRSKGGKGRQLLLDKQFYIPTATTTQVVSKVEQNIIKELSTALYTSDAILGKQQSTMHSLRKDKKALQRKLRTSANQKKK